MHSLGKLYEDRDKVRINSKATILGGAKLGQITGEGSINCRLGGNWFGTLIATGMPVHSHGQRNVGPRPMENIRGCLK